MYFEEPDEGKNPNPVLLGAHSDLGANTPLGVGYKLYSTGNVVEDTLPA